jgi:drug/metabolite transporter (DMT)-like permease
MAIAALITSIPLLIAEIWRGEFVWPTATGYALLLYAALGPAFIAQLLYMRGVQLIGPGRAGVFVNLVPVFGALLAVALLGEPFAGYHLFALLLVVGGIAIAQFGATAKLSRHRDETSPMSRDRTARDRAS